VANFADPKKIEEAARLRSQGVSLRQISKLTGLHRETIVTHTGRGVVSRSEAMTIYHARRKGLVINAGEFTVKPIGAPVPIKKDPTQERFQNHLHLVTLEAKFALRKMSLLYDLKTLEHFGSIGLWNACTRFTGDDATFPFYARVRIRGQIWDEIRGEAALPRRMLKAENKPRFNDVDEVILASHLPPPDDVAHFREVLRQVDSVPLRDRERQVLEALALGDQLRNVALAWGTTEPRVSQIKARVITKMAALIRKADL